MGKFLWILVWEGLWLDFPNYQRFPELLEWGVLNHISLAIHHPGIKRGRPALKQGHVDWQMDVARLVKFDWIPQPIWTPISQVRRGRNVYFAKFDAHLIDNCYCFSPKLQQYNQDDDSSNNPFPFFAKEILHYYLPGKNIAASDSTILPHPKEQDSKFLTPNQPINTLAIAIIFDV